MAIIYKTTDRIKIKIDDMVIHVSPLSFEQKSKVQAIALEDGKTGSMHSAKEAIRLSVKDIDGVFLSDGSRYQLERDNEGVLTNACVDDLMNLKQTDKLIFVTMSMAQQIPDKFTHPATGEKLSGVSFVEESTRKKSKKVGA